MLLSDEQVRAQLSQPFTEKDLSEIQDVLDREPLHRINALWSHNVMSRLMATIRELQK